MVITGVTMDPVYGRAGKKYARAAGAGAIGKEITRPVLVEAAPAKSMRVP